jgi:protein-tyrosine phosphatase
MVDAAHSSGLDLSNHQARMIKSTDFLEFDFIVAMDRDIHLRLQDMRPQNYKAKIVPYQGSSLEEMVDVPDPYYTEDFAGVMKQIIDGASGLVNRIL